MKLLECEAKEVFGRFQIPIPVGRVATSPKEAGSVASEIGRPVAIKAQLPVGGRGKAGGIAFADNPEGAREIAEKLLGTSVRGIEVKRLLVEEKLGILKELYLGFTVDRGSRSYVALASTEGGVDIEEVAARTPEKIVKHVVGPLDGLRMYHARLIARRLGFSGRQSTELADIILRLFRVAVEMDAELTEINPMALTERGFVAADARLNIDDNALFRHRDLVDKYRKSELSELSPKELEARRLGVAYVELDGNIGIVGNGAGLTMATLDTVMLRGGRPGDFLDLGGGAPQDRIGAAVSFLLSDTRIDALFVNILGGITRCDDTARGIIDARHRTGSGKPIVVRMVGTNEEEGRRILKEEGIESLETMEEAAERVVRLSGRH